MSFRRARLWLAVRQCIRSCAGVWFMTLPASTRLLLDGLREPPIVLDAVAANDDVATAFTQHNRLNFRNLPYAANTSVFV